MLVRSVRVVFKKGDVVKINMRGFTTGVLDWCNDNIAHVVVDGAIYRFDIEDIEAT